MAQSTDVIESDGLDILSIPRNIVSTASGHSIGTACANAVTCKYAAKILNIPVSTSLCDNCLPE